MQDIYSVRTFYFGVLTLYFSQFFLWSFIFLHFLLIYVIYLKVAFTSTFYDIWNSKVYSILLHILIFKDSDASVPISDTAHEIHVFIEWNCIYNSCCASSHFAGLAQRSVYAQFKFWTHSPKNKLVQVHFLLMSCSKPNIFNNKNKVSRFHHINNRSIVCCCAESEEEEQQRCSVYLAGLRTKCYAAAQQRFWGI